MSWLFSQALVEAYSPPNSAATEPCAQLNVMPTLQGFWRNDKMIAPLRLSRSGLTCALLTEDRGAALLTSYLADSLAKTFPSPGPDLGLMASDQVSGQNLPGLFAMYAQDGSEWKTPQCSLLGDLESFSETWPRSGLMLNGMCYQRQTLVPHISVNAFGLLLPTLTVCGNYNAKGASATSDDGLVTALKRFPTLVARDYRHPGRSRMERTGGTQGEHLPNIVGGPLNPDWCEWFMGWPIGWTASKPLAMDKFQEWRQQHGACSLQPTPPSPNERKAMP